MTTWLKFRPAPTMVLTRRALAATAACLVLGGLQGCSEMISVKVVGRLPQPEFHFSHRSGHIPGLGPSICIRSLDVTDMTTHYVTWSIVASGGCVRLEKITFAELPDGFSEITASRALVSGDQYQVEVGGPGFGGEQKFSLHR